MHLTKQSCISGLTSSQHKLAAAGVITVRTRTTDIPVSGIVVTISQSGSTSASVTTPTTSPVQKHIELNGQFNCAVGDILTVSVTSAASGDQPPNLIKTTIDLKQGV